MANAWEWLYEHFYINNCQQIRKVINETHKPKRKKSSNQRKKKTILVFNV